MAEFNSVYYSHFFAHYTIVGDFSFSCKGCSKAMVLMVVSLMLMWWETKVIFDLEGVYVWEMCVGLSFCN